MSKEKTYSHLDLRKRIHFPRKSRSPPPPPRMNIDQKFYDDQKHKIQKISKKFENDKKKYSKYFKPHLIFKITLSKKPSELFRTYLKNLGIETLSSSSSNLLYWVTMTDDPTFQKLKNAISKRLKHPSDKPYGTSVDYIESIEPIPPKDKLGNSLLNKPVTDSESEYFDVEIWRMSDNELNEFIIGFTKLIDYNHGRIDDQSRTENFCVLRIYANGKLIDTISKIREIAHIDRPPRIKLEHKLSTNLDDIDPQKPPKMNLPGILIVDSGILRHPVLEKSIMGNMITSGDFSTQHDDSTHGTEVASIALYGDINNCLIEKKFHPEILLYSAKVMHEKNGYAIFDDTKLLERQLEYSIKKITNENKNCQIINISFGNLNNIIGNVSSQFRIASLIDDLAYQYKDLLFFISVGNIDSELDNVNLKQYPEYFLQNNNKIRIIDPATSVHGISVGSIYPVNTINNNGHWPSNFTRIGPGLLNMIKPELVENGGNDDNQNEIITANPTWIKDGKLFTLNIGTSFSAPLVAHQMAKLKNKFPNESRNLLKALLISSATIPNHLPDKLDKINQTQNDIELKKILNIFGYGKPNLNNALYSESTRVVFKHTGDIHIGDIELFEIILPTVFINTPGKRSIEVTLVFDPPIDRKTSDYVGVSMEYRLFKNSTIDEVKTQYKKISDDDPTDNTVIGEIDMNPKLCLRSKGIHQKSIKYYKRNPRFKKNSLILLVSCKKKWFNDLKYIQQYAVVVTIKHDAINNLYNEIKTVNPIRERIRS